MATKMSGTFSIWPDRVEATSAVKEAEVDDDGLTREILQRDSLERSLANIDRDSRLRPDGNRICASCSRKSRLHRLSRAERQRLLLTVLHRESTPTPHPATT